MSHPPIAETRRARLNSLVRTSRQLTTLAAPIAGVQFAQVALTATDLAIMGLIGVQAIAAGGLAATLYNLMRTMCVGVVTAVGNLVAGAAGRAASQPSAPASWVAYPPGGREGPVSAAPPRPGVDLSGAKQQPPINNLNKLGGPDGNNHSTRYWNL